MKYRNGPTVHIAMRPPTLTKASKVAASGAVDTNA